MGGHKHDINERIQREARIAGIRDFHKPSIEDVERRRLQLWAVAVVVLLTLSLATAVASWSQDYQEAAWLQPGMLRLAVVVLALGFSAYAIEKEIHLHRLARLLVDERVLNSALTNRLQLHSALTAAGKAVNSVLELDEVLDVILASALEMLEGNDGSIMLIESDGHLRVAATQGNDLSRDLRIALEETVASDVARTREPVVLNGSNDTARFPGVAITGDQPESAMCVPLENRGELLGVINVAAVPGRRFDEYDCHVLMLFAEPVAAAITNARLYEAERAHVAELLELDRMKSQFVATVSHELRTPITSIRGAIAASRRPLRDDQRGELMDVIDRQTNRLQTMVEEMFAAAQLERHGAVPLLRRIDVAALVRMVALDSQVAGRPVEVQAPEFCEVRADPEAMRRTLANLIENAHKYGGAPVKVLVEPNPGDLITLSVLDSGSGVPMADREKIFERFYRADRTKNRPGLGLGLPIVRGLVEACGGRVWVEDAPGGGAAFKVQLRARTADEGVARGVMEHAG